MLANWLDTGHQDCYLYHGNLTKAERNVAIITSGGDEMGSSDLDFGFQGLRNTQFGNNLTTGGASHLIRSAERLAASGRFDFAIEQLTVAQRLDPENRYIHAIIDRIRVLQDNAQDESSNPDSISERSGQLSVTVGPQFADGLKSKEGGQQTTDEDVPKKIRFLTNMANQFVENGLSEKAFDSLMKAYLLDPISPYVIAAEKTVLPAWEFTRTQNNPQTGQPESTIGTSNMSKLATENMIPSNSDRANSAFTSAQSRSPQSSDEQLRMEVLRQQKEHERVEKERGIWREASKAPRVFGEDDPVNPPSAHQQVPEPPKPQATGLFSKLRLGKFLE